MTVHKWMDLDRETLSALLPHAVVLLPVGAVEQHGPHLPTGTDSKIAGAIVADAAVRASDAGASVIVAPTVSVGASEHHIPLGGTLSIRAETLLSLLTDLVSSMAAAGATSVLIVNGHGGNSGICHAAASTASSRSEIDVAHVDYWRLLGDSEPGVPGHAGWFETSVILALHPSSVTEVAPRSLPPVAAAESSGVVRHSPELWRSLNGYTDDPGAATPARGARYLEQLANRLAKVIMEVQR